MGKAMKPGEGPGIFLADLALNVPDDEMRTRWRQGLYGTGKMAPRADLVAGWRKAAGR